MPLDGTVNISNGVSHSWLVQFFIAFSILFVFIVILIWNYHFLPTPAICTSEPFPEWTKQFTVVIVGASIGSTIQMLFRALIFTAGYTSEQLRHPYATGLMIFICSIQAMSHVLYQSGLIAWTCVDFLGVKSNPLQWLEWTTTVPFLFFLVSVLDMNRHFVTSTDYLIEFLGGSSIFCTFLVNLPIPTWICWGLFIYANLGMGSAIAWQQILAYQQYKVSCQELANQKGKNPDSNIPRILYDQLKVCQCKMNASVCLSFFFILFPLWYYLNIFNCIDESICFILTFASSYLSKFLFLQVIADSHVEILDPSKFLVMEERKKAEESRLMFLRYVFHEVRVPLNSISLGLQLINDSPHITPQDHEMINMMNEATTFMSETLNDVLSFQKMEQGMLELEIQPFVPIDLVQSVLHNFRTQCESKSIRTDFQIDSDVPLMILGDKFRLEHVLGNLLSNAIKFSDPNSHIQINVKFESEEKYVTFFVIDEGPGISADDQKLLFQPFMQIRPGELQKGRGSGLGLSICKNIIELHYGKIGCRSQLRCGTDRTSGGSTFYFSLQYHGEILEKHLAMAKSETSESGIAPIANSKSNEPQPAAQAHHNATTSSVLSAVVSEIDATLQKKRSLHPTDFVALRSMARRSELAQERFQQRYSRSRSRSNSTEGCSLAESSISSCGLDSTAFPSSHVERNLSVDTSMSSSSDGTVQARKALGLAVDHEIPASISETCTAVSTKTFATDPEYSSIKFSSAAKGFLPGIISPLTPSTGVPVVSLFDHALSSTAQSPSDSSIFNILIVDDVLSNRKMLDMTLRRKGFVCDQAVDGEEAVKRVQEKGIDFYDIIFMDSVMPVMCGPDAARMLRELGYKNLLIGVTGNAMDIDVAEFELAGADTVLTKPMRVEALTKVLEFCHKVGCISHFNCTPSLPENDRLKAWMNRNDARY